MMNSIERQPVPLGGSRVPDSMGGTSCPPWQELAEQEPQQAQCFGEACNLVMSLREQIGTMKKQISSLAVPMKAYIYSKGTAGNEPQCLRLSVYGRHMRNQNRVYPNIHIIP